MDIGLNAKPKTIKLLEDNTEENLYEFWLGTYFLDTKLKSSIKEEIHRLDFIKI